MNERTLHTTNSPSITVQSGGRLHLVGWDQPEVRARANSKDLALEQDGETVTVKSDASLDVRVPRGASLTITAFDDTTLKQVEGGVTIRQCGGSLTLASLGAVTIESVENDLNAKRLSGKLHAGQVGRHAYATELASGFHADSIGAHLNLKHSRGDVTAQVDGNANLKLDLQPGDHCRVTASGSLTCRVAPGTNAAVSLASPEKILAKVAGRRETSDSGKLDLTLGDGSAVLELISNGPLTLSEYGGAAPSVNLDFDLSLDPAWAEIGADLGDQITGQLSAQLEAVEDQLEASMEGFYAVMGSLDLSPEKAERIRQRTQEKIARAQDKIKRAQERAAQKIEQARHRAERETARAERAEQSRSRDQRRSWTLNLGAPPKKKTDPVSDEERMVILNMLAEKKISLAEAESLLAALEGK
jgi:ElaB/YqjD/DUF883 family membrane-anchored ribosome-binding protein